MAKRKTRKSAYIPPTHEVVNRKERSQQVRTVRGAGPNPRGGRAAANLEPPTWGRTLRRIPVYFLLIFALQYVMAPDAIKDDTVARVLQAGTLAGLVTLAFLPLMYTMEKWQYTRMVRSGKITPPPAKRSHDSLQHPDANDAITNGIADHDA